MQLPLELRRPSRPALAKAFVIHLDAPKRVTDGLRKVGWHSGFCRDDETGYDKGLISICSDFPDKESRLQALATAIRTLQNEAEAIHHGVAVIWHPEIEADMVRAATTSTVIAITSKTIREAAEQWDEIKSQFYRLPV